MAIVKVRKVGGSAMLTIPPSILAELPFGVESSVSLSVSGGVLTVTPEKKRHRLDDLLAEHEMSTDKDWLDMPSIGEEL